MKRLLCAAALMPLLLLADGPKSPQKGERYRLDNHALLIEPGAMMEFAFALALGDKKRIKKFTHGEELHSVLLPEGTLVVVISRARMEGKKSDYIVLVTAEAKQDDGEVVPVMGWVESGKLADKPQKDRVVE